MSYNNFMVKGLGGIGRRPGSNSKNEKKKKPIKKNYFMVHRKKLLLKSATKSTTSSCFIFDCFSYSWMYLITAIVGVSQCSALKLNDGSSK